MFTNIQTYYDYDNPNSVNYIDLQISTSRITGWITAIDKYEKGMGKWYEKGMKRL